MKLTTLRKNKVIEILKVINLSLYMLIRFSLLLIYLHIYYHRHIVVSLYYKIKYNIQYYITKIKIYKIKL